MPVAQIDRLATPKQWARIVENIDAEGDCWLWTGRLDRDGYGKYGDYLAHRLVYLHLVGHLPEGLVSDHQCRVRRCVNPDHLEFVPDRVNVARGVSLSALNARKTSCKRGHPFSPENTYVYGRSRTCRICNRAAVARSVARRKQLATEARR